MYTKNSLLIIMASMMMHSLVFAEPSLQDTSYWKCKNQVSLFFNQTSFGDYWKGGGANAIAAGFELNSEKNFTRDHHSWKNKFIFKYGVIKLNKAEFQKNSDRIELDSKYGFKLNENFLLSCLLNFTSRLHDTYQIMSSGERGKLIGNFLAPGYVNFGSGLNYEQDKKTVAIYYTPVNSKITIVRNEKLRDQFIPKEITGSTRYELGSFLRLELKKEILPNVTLLSKSNLFTNYMVKFGNLDVDFLNQLKFKINENLSANLVAHIIYDEDILFDIEQEDGNLYQGPRTQFKEVFNIGFTGKF